MNGENLPPLSYDDLILLNMTLGFDPGKFNAYEYVHGDLNVLLYDRIIRKFTWKSNAYFYAYAINATKFYADALCQLKVKRNINLSNCSDLLSTENLKCFVIFQILWKTHSMIILERIKVLRIQMVILVHNHHLLVMVPIQTIIINEEKLLQQQNH